MATTAGAAAGNQRRIEGGQVVPYSRFRHQAVDWLGLMHGRHTAHLLVEVDVTGALEALRAHRAGTGEDLSLTALVVASLARAVAEDRSMHAYRRGRNSVLLFDDVDVALLLEQQADPAAPGPLQAPGRTPQIVRAADKKRLGAIEREIRAAGAGRSLVTVWLPFWLLLPAPARALFWRGLLANPRLRKRLTGTVALAAVEASGPGGTTAPPASTGRRWGIPLVAYTLAIALGGLVRTPGAAPAAASGQGVREQAGDRTHLCLTISTDDDLIGGGQAARFAGRLQELIEGHAGLDPAAPDRPPEPAPGREQGRQSPDGAARAAAAVTAIKSIHTAIFLGMGSCVGYIVYSGLVGRISGLTRLAMVTLTGEGVIYARNGFRCPLADMAEDLGAESGTVGDIFLPGWFERRIPQISSALLVVAVAAYALRWGMRRR